MAGGREGKEEEREIRKGREGGGGNEGILKVQIHAHFVCPFYYWLPFLYTVFLFFVML